MEKEIIFLVEESPEGGYEARALGYSIYTEADTFQALKGMVQDAVACHFEEAERPPPHSAASGEMNNSTALAICSYLCHNYVHMRRGD